MPLGQKEREEDDQFNGQESVVREKRGKASRAQHTEGIKTQNGAKSEFAKRQRGASVSMVLLFARDPIQDLQGPGPGAWQAGGRRYWRASPFSSFTRVAVDFHSVSPFSNGHDKGFIIRIWGLLLVCLLRRKVGQRLHGLRCCRLILVIPSLCQTCPRLHLCDVSHCLFGIGNASSCNWTLLSTRLPLSLGTHL